MIEGYDLSEVLQYIDPAVLGYQDWVNVGMALKEEGHTAAEWEAWSRQDTKRYHKGECIRKWNSFNGAADPVTGGTIVQMAKDHGWLPERDTGYELEWDGIIKKDAGMIVDKNWLESREITAPDAWDPREQLITYLETLFDSTECVGYVTRSLKGW